LRADSVCSDSSVSLLDVTARSSFESTH
jgi:hypothetical protein